MGRLALRPRARRRVRAWRPARGSRTARLSRVHFRLDAGATDLQSQSAAAVTCELGLVALVLDSLQLLAQLLLLLPAARLVVGARNDPDAAETQTGATTGSVNGAA